MLNLKISWPYLIKGVIYASIMMVGTLLGVLLRYSGVQGFIIWGITGTLNVIATVIVFYLLKEEIKKWKEPEKKDEKKFSSQADKKQSSNKVVKEDTKKKEEDFVTESDA